MDKSMLETDALMALLEKLKELAAQEKGEGDLLDDAAADLEQAAGETEEAPTAELPEDDESLPLFAGMDKPPMRERTSMGLGGAGKSVAAAPAPKKKGRYA